MGQVLPGRRLDSRYFQQKVKLGEGSVAVVWRAIDRHSHTPVAIKQIDKRRLFWNGIKRTVIMREIGIMKVCAHENIITLFDAFEDDQFISLALEYCDGGDFGDKVKERGRGLREREAAVWMRQILSAIAALHRTGICHRDVKPDNFMVSRGALKLADFGLAAFLPKGSMLTEKSGTSAFMAPEQHQLPHHSKGYGFPVDLWAAGVTLHMLICGGRHPFIDTMGCLDKSRLLLGSLDFGGFEDPIGFAAQQLYFSDTARSFCRSLVDTDPGRRLTADAALQDPWFEAASGALNKSILKCSSTVDPHVHDLEEKLAAAEQEIQAASERAEILRNRLATQAMCVVPTKEPSNLLPKFTIADSGVIKCYDVPWHKFCCNMASLVPPEVTEIDVMSSANYHPNNTGAKDIREL